ncbi:MAG: site-specific integrase [Oscillospiraceae bacterium]|nr:site-specific integrase [Oscillospiraceae bacterium]
MQNTVIGAVERHLETSSLRLKPSTLGIYRRHLERYIAPYFGNADCGSLTSDTAQDFVNRLLKQNGLSVNTVQSVFNLLKASVGIPLKVEFPKRPKCLVDSLSVGEQKRIEQAARSRDSNDYVAVILCLYTGIRIGEACALRWTDISFERNLLRVNRTIQRIRTDDGKTEIAFLTPKTPTSERAIPLPEFLRGVLLDFKADSPTEWVLSYKGKPIEPRTLQNRFKKILESAGVRDIKFHQTRHAFATRALESGFDVKTLSEVLGHTSAAVTLSIYSHSTFEHKQKCMNSLSAVYSAR